MPDLFQWSTYIMFTWFYFRLVKTLWRVQITIFSQINVNCKFLEVNVISYGARFAENPPCLQYESDFIYCRYIYSTLRDFNFSSSKRRTATRKGDKQIKLQRNEHCSPHFIVRKHNASDFELSCIRLATGQKTLQNVTQLIWVIFWGHESETRKEKFARATVEGERNIIYSLLQLTASDVHYVLSVSTLLVLY